MSRARNPQLDELFRAMRDARRQARAEHLDRRVPVLDRDFDNFAMGA